jgi:hypothetical protein
MVVVVRVKVGNLTGGGGNGNGGLVANLFDEPENAAARTSRKGQPAAVPTNLYRFNGERATVTDSVVVSLPLHGTL